MSIERIIDDYFASEKGQATLAWYRRRAARARSKPPTKQELATLALPFLFVVAERITR